MANYNIDVVDGTVLTDPFGSVLYDSGGSGGNYSPNDNHSVTINPGGSYLTLKFDLHAEMSWDFLTIRNGTSASAPVVWVSQFQSNYDIVIPSTTLTSGAAHITFTSDGSVQMAGFEMTWRDLKLSPVAYYNMENGSGTTLTDRSIVGNALDGTLTNSGMWNPAAPAGSSSIYFAANSDEVSIPKDAATDFDVADSFSIATWIKFPYSASSSWKVICSNDNTQAYVMNYRGFTFALLNGKPYWMMQDQWNVLQKGIGRYGTSQIADNTWKHVAVTYDGSSSSAGLTIHVNGVEETYGGTYPPNANGLGAGTTIISPANTRIGQGFHGLYHLNGAYIDELSIWNFQLTQSEIIDLYDSGAPLDLEPPAGGGGGGSKRKHRTSINNLKLKI